MKIIKLTRGYSAIVDDFDYEVLSRMKWQSHICKNKVYAARRPYIGRRLLKSIRKSMLMHRFILGLIGDKNIQVDHINGNGLDNRRCNLRPCTGQQNQWNKEKPKNNTSGYKGVVWDKENKKWMSRIKLENKTKHIGRFINKVDAAKAYDDKAREIFGEYARTNF